MKRAIEVWVGFWTAFGVGNFIASKFGRSLCATNRWAFMRTKRGRILWSIAYWAGSLILFLHVHQFRPFRRPQ